MTERPTTWDPIDEDEEPSLEGLDPAFVESLHGLPVWARRNLVAEERDVLAIQARRAERIARRGAASPGDGVEQGEDSVEDELRTGTRIQALRAAVQTHRIAVFERDAAVLAAREAGYGWAYLARIVGVSRQALQQRLRP